MTGEASMNIYCPNCENACWEDAEVCPKCGHGLAHGTAKDRVLLEIRTLRIVGAVVLFVGVAVFAFALTRDISLSLGGLGLMLYGFGLRCLAGIWGTLERISRK